MTCELRSLAVTIGRIVGRLWRFVARRRLGRDDLWRASEALNRLRRGYVFGGVSRETYEAQMLAYRRLMPWQRRARTAKKVASGE